MKEWTVIFPHIKQDYKRAVKEKKKTGNSDETSAPYPLCEDQRTKVNPRFNCFGSTCLGMQSDKNGTNTCLNKTCTLCPHRCQAGPLLMHALSNVS